MTFGRIGLVAAAVAVLAQAPPVYGAKAPEIRWAEPFVVRRGETVTLAVVGRRLPREAEVSILDEGRPDPRIRVLGWERPSARRGQLTVEVGPGAAVGLRGLELTPADQAPVLQEVVFRVADDVRLPWPHEPPNASPGEREELRDQVFVINDYGLYQASNVPSESYFHDGLDLVLPAGTPLYSLADGIVRDIFLPSDTGSRWIAVEDLDRPGFGWLYVHSDGFRLGIGDTVEKGRQIAEVAVFNGLEHLHLSRIFVPEGESWGSLVALHSHFDDDVFDIRDRRPPTIGRRLYLFRNESDDLLTSAGGPPTASGDVDLVVEIQDGGHYAHSQDPNFLPGVGDRLAPAVVRCEVLDRRGRRVAQWTRDLTRIVLHWDEGQTTIWAPERVAVVYRSHLDIPGGRFAPYLVLTNVDGIDRIGDIRPGDTAYSWETAALPDGPYTVRVTAWDSAGNRATRNQRVRVRN